MQEFNTQMEFKMLNIKLVWLETKMVSATSNSVSAPVPYSSLKNEGYGAMLVCANHDKQMLVSYKMHKKADVSLIFSLRSGMML